MKAYLIEGKYEWEVRTEHGDLLARHYYRSEVLRLTEAWWMRNGSGRLVVVREEEAESCQP